jgi:predicted  nucleic acid-binding Zn-ribbon protein
MDNNFIDLRLNQQSNQGEDSFWPSFTDIMTVIVMIFLLAMVILLIRNMELLSQLRLSIASEQEALELVRTTDEEKETIEERLIAREHEISMLRMQLMQMTERTEEQEAAISSQRFQITNLSRERDALVSKTKTLTQEREQLTTQVARLNQETGRLQTQISDANQSIENLRLDLAQANTRQENTLQDLDELRITLREKDQELLAALTRNQEADEQLIDLKQDYSKLKIQYNKLLRPARTAKGKTVVEVRYTKSGKYFRIDYKGPGDSRFSSISRKKLEQNLSRLKQQENNLYVKVIIPKNSGLSYNEAWSFTNHLHQSYDYYYQEEAQKERIVE